MTGDEQRSARWSARVDQGDAIAPGQTPAPSFKAPESVDVSALSGSRSECLGRRVSRDELDRVAQSLTDRDRAILATLDAFGLLRTAHIQQLHFLDHAVPDTAARLCRRTLRRLRDHRLVEPIERRIGGIRAGSQGTVWRLGPSGDRLRRLEDATLPRARRREPSLRFLEHRMLVADVACTLTTAAHGGLFELLELHPEPACWRPYRGSHGSREILKPDLFAVTAVDDYSDSWLVECDRGTESLPTLLKQCHQYETYRRSGQEQASHGVFPRVLWLVPDSARRDRLRAGLQDERGLDAGLFRVQTFQELLAVIAGGAA